jgi:two-component system, OmpR family, response regulator
MVAMKLSKVLLVEDDRSIAGALAHALHDSYDIDVASSGKLALYKTDTEKYDAIVLDLNLPDISGIFICQQLRERGVSAPILILSGETRVLTKINLLDSGANDYLTKPFSLGELKARLRVLVRTTNQPAHKTSKITVGELVMNRNIFTVYRGENEIVLRRKEFAILECLMENAGTVVTREMLLRTVWHGSDELWTNTVDVHIKHLRDKIDRPFAGRMIRTVHGLGYKLEAFQPLIMASKE